MLNPFLYTVILDRDRTINEDPGYLNDPDKVVLMPHAAEGIHLLNDFGLRIFVASNQSGIARGLITNAQLAAVNMRISALLAKEGAHLENFYICPHTDDDNCVCRKPKPGLIQKIWKENTFDAMRTFLVGDRARDLLCGQALGMRGILVGDDELDEPENCVFRAAHLGEAAAFILETIFEEATRQKIFTDAKDFLAYFENGRKNYHKIVFTNGCFDLLHSGHVQLLSQARALGDYLILGLNSDRSVRVLKGDTRPLNKAIDRARVLAQLYSVDAVVIFDEDTPIELLQKIRPDIQVKGGDYIKEDLPEYPIMQKMGKKIVILPFRKGYSTTSLIQKMQ
ncbi:MAG TPA: D-glycero-beta-D-manno-heptose 1-phosphate adenylyltransferase [Turneriella sp.]|nr:D-glycero-beta-D-manno-heptose 1-phosphate adenylyltransferase [Turneriella sp.]